MRLPCMIGLALLLSGCGPGGGPERVATGNELAASEPLPSVLGIGRAATPGEVDRIDIDVMPDGTGLPPGGGTAAAGAETYSLRCAPCHGADGEGSEAAPPLVGRRPDDRFDFADTYPTPRRTIGNYWPYATTIFDYVRRAMPFDRPGSLTDQEVYALTAWLLWKSGLIDEDAAVDAASLPTVAMPARFRFVLDDRESSDRVR